MTQVIAGALLDAYKNTIGLLGDTIRNFDDATWQKGLEYFQMPAKVAYHTVECLDFYFKPKGASFTWGKRFGKPWWELPDDEQPSQAYLLTWLEELQARIIAHFGEVQDESLDRIYDPTLENGLTEIAWYLYALRHTVHHHGSLAALADIQGVSSGDWEKW